MAKVPTREFLILGHGDALDAAVDQMVEQARAMGHDEQTPVETRLIEAYDSALAALDSPPFEDDGYNESEPSYVPSSTDPDGWGQAPQ